VWSYYGSKAKIVRNYPEPLYDLIIEPFAGAAWYSLYYSDSRVLLNDKSKTIALLWSWLINVATPEIILAHKDFHLGQDISKLRLPKSHLDLIGFCINRGSITPKNIVQRWSCQVKSDPFWASTTAFQLKRIARRLHEIKTWVIRCEDYKDLPNIEATWFVDPPYQHGGNLYPEHDIDYSLLATWCKARKGQVIVCENERACWLPFVPLVKSLGQRNSHVEMVWMNK
jgi:site-specific DNA-adenine methylase